MLSDDHEWMVHMIFAVSLVLRIFALAPVGIPRAARSSALAVDGAVFTGVFDLVNAIAFARIARTLGE